MEFIEWDDSYSVGVTIIDKQHRRLIGLINTFHGAMKCHKSREIMGPLFDNLLKYTDCHFQMEETYFDQFHYEDTESHKKEHQKLIDQVTELKTRFEQDNNFVFTAEVMIFLKEWLVEHILKSDKKYSQCFIDNGLS